MITVGAQHVRVQPILCYSKGLIAPFVVQKAAVRNAICCNYPAVEIAPPYLTWVLTQEWALTWDTTVSTILRCTNSTEKCSLYSYLAIGTWKL